MAEAPSYDDEIEDDSRGYSDAKDDRKESNDESSNEIKISRSEIEKYFKVHLMYGAELKLWATRTCLHYTLDLPSSTEHSVKYRNSAKLWNDKKTKTNDKPDHAEDKLLNALESEITTIRFQELAVKGDTQAISRNDKIINLNIVMNYSPCSECAEKIVQFWRKHEDWEWKISITFGTFYKFYPNNDTNKNVEGLANLWNAGIKLQLVWDDDKLNKYIEKIGTTKQKEARKSIDRQYLQDVKQKARQIDSGNAV